MKRRAWSLVIAGILLGGGLGMLANLQLLRAAEVEAGRPDEAAMFGAPAALGKVTAPATATTPANSVESLPRPENAEGRDARELNSANPARDAFATGEVTDNALSVGGLFYQRSSVSAQKGTGTSQTPLSLPLQFDGFLDARPSDRVRGFVDGRLLFDASRDSNSKPTGGNNAGSLQFSSTSAAPSSVSGVTTASTPGNPQMVLDQAWLKFDIDHAVFVTAGKQHVKWGTSRFWNPTDFLNTQRRDPLLPYDLRLGNSMLKLALPIESRHANLYAIGLFDNPQAASTLGQLGGAMRAEAVIGNAEVGVEAMTRGGRGPVYGADLSAPAGPFDVYAEVACTTEAATPFYQVNSGLVSGADLSTLVSTVTRGGPFMQVSGGANYSFGWKENRLATVGVEYFYNQLGYNSANVYPALIFFGQYQPFYTGKNYAAFYLTAEGPDAEKHTSYGFSTLGNLSDSSFISRVDFTWRMLTYLTLEAFVDAHYGTTGGEFNFALSTPLLTYLGSSISPVAIPRTVGDLGLALRLSF